MSTSNAILITQLLLDYALRMQEASNLLNRAATEGRDVTDEEVEASSLRRDAALARLGQVISGA